MKSGHDLQVAREWLAEYGYEACMYLRPEPDALASAALIARRAAADVSFVDPYGEHLDRTGPMVLIDQGNKRIASSAPVLRVGRAGAAPPLARREAALREPKAPATSMVAWRLIETPGELSWLAALGVLDNRADAGALTGRSAALGADLRRLLALCRAPTLLRAGPIRLAFTMLWGAATPQEALASDAARRLAHVLGLVQAHGRSAAQTKPQSLGSAALVDIDVPAFVQARVAALWAERLSPRPVIVANHGWHDHKVAYAIRSKEENVLRAWLARANTLTTTPSGRPAVTLAPDGEISERAFERLTGAIGPS